MWGLLRLTGTMAKGDSLATATEVPHASCVCSAIPILSFLFCYYRLSSRNAVTTVSVVYTNMGALQI